MRRSNPRKMYHLTRHGHPISKPHPHRITCYIEAIERGLPVTAHAALLARVRLALLDRGQAVVIEYA